MNLCDILKERDLRGKRNESLMFNCLEDSFLANYETEPYDFIHSSDNPLSTIAIAVSPDGDTVATTHGDHTVKVFKLSSGKSLRTFIGHPRTPWTVKYNPANSCILASGCLGFEVRVWDIMHGSLLNLLRLDSCVITLAFHPSGEFILASSGPHLHTWCWKEGTLCYCYILCSNRFYSYFLFCVVGETSNNLNTNLSSSSSAPSVKRKSRIVTHSRNIRAVVFHPSGRFVFVAAPDPPMGPDPTRGPTAANRLYGFAFSTLFSGPYLEPILLMNQRTVIPEVKFIPF